MLFLIKVFYSVVPKLADAYPIGTVDAYYGWEEGVNRKIHRMMLLKYKSEEICQ